MASTLSNNFNVTINRAATQTTSQTTSNSFNVTINRPTSPPTNPNKVIESNNFGVTINRPIAHSTEPNTVIEITKAGVALTPVNGTPTTGQYKVTITNTVNCEARLESDYKTITVTSATGNKGQIDIRVNIENKRVYTKTIPVATMLKTTEVNRKMSEVKQTADALTAKFTDGFDMGITQVTKDGIKVYHNRIDGENYTHMSPSGFYIKHKGKNKFICDSNGLTYKGTITGSSITGSEISSNGSNGDWTYINGGYIECGGTIDRSWMGESFTDHTIKLKSENGKFRARNDYTNTSLYFGDRGISTTSDANLGSSGTIDFHSYWYDYGSKGVVLYSNHNVGLVAYNGPVNISPEWNNAGNNTFSFQVLDSNTAGTTHGLIYYGSHINGYATCIQVSKNTNDSGINILDGNRNDNAYLQASHLYTSMLNNNYWTNGTLTINQEHQGTQGGTQTYLSGTAISATTIYQNGSKVTGSDIILKDNIKEYEGNALDIVNKTNIYSFNRISDPNRTEIGFIAQQVPDELIYQRGKFTAEELEGLTPKEKTALLEQAQIEANKEVDIQVYEKVAEEYASFYDLDAEQTQEQINKIQAEVKNVEYKSPVSMLHENNIIGIMWKAIQELSKKVDELSK